MHIGPELEEVRQAIPVEVDRRIRVAAGEIGRADRRIELRGQVCPSRVVPFDEHIVRIGNRPRRQVGKASQGKPRVDRVQSIDAGPGDVGPGERHAHGLIPGGEEIPLVDVPDRVRGRHGIRRAA